MEETEKKMEAAMAKRKAEEEANSAEAKLAKKKADDEPVTLAVKADIDSPCPNI